MSVLLRGNLPKINLLAELIQCILNSTNGLVVNEVYVWQNSKCTNFVRHLIVTSPGYVLRLVVDNDCAMLCSCEWWWVKRQDLQCNMCELGKFNIEKYQHVIVFLYLCRVLFFKVPQCIFVGYMKQKRLVKTCQQQKKRNIKNEH